MRSARIDRWSFAALLLLIGTGLAGNARAEAPALLGVQGVIRDNAGAPVTGTFGVHFAFYAAESGGTALWEETLAGVTVANGVFSAVLGHDPAHALPTDLFVAQPDLFLGIRVEAEAELPRQRLVSVPYALESYHADLADRASALDCAGCVTVDQLGFDPATQNELDVLRTNPLAGINCAPGYLLMFNGTQWVCSGDYVNQAALFPYVTQAELDAALAELGQTLGLLQADCQVGQMPAWDGSQWICQDPLTDLPADGLNEISNNLLTNQFTDQACATDTPRSIPDGVLGGLTDTLTFPDVGTAQSLSVSLRLTNSDLNHLRVVLTDPAGVSFVLWCGSGVLGFAECTQSSTATELQATYPATPAALGDLTTWLGRNPTGTWTLRVIDYQWSGGGNDGQVTSFCVSTQTLSDHKVMATGDLVIEGNLTLGGTGCIKLGSCGTCDATTEGMLRYNSSRKAVEFCNGTEWTGLAPQYYRSCNAIKLAGAAAGDGMYIIDPDGSGGLAPFAAYCDMTTSGGGWTRILIFDGNAEGNNWAAHVAKWTSVDSGMGVYQCGSFSNAVGYANTDTSSYPMQYYTADVEKYVATEARFEHRDSIVSWDGALLFSVTYSDDTTSQQIYNNHSCGIPTGACSGSEEDASYNTTHNFASAGKTLRNFRWGVKTYQGACGDYHVLYRYVLWVR